MEYSSEQTGEKITFEIDKGKRKNVYICVKNGEVVVKLPTRVPKEMAIAFVKKKEEWILQKLRETKQREEKYEEGSPFLVLGRTYFLQIEEGRKQVFIQGNKLCVPVPLGTEESKIKEKIETFYLKLAKEKIPPIMEKMILKVGQGPDSYQIRNLKKVWGNCSSKRKIHLNKNLVKYDTEIMEYVCIHELCHLTYMNHSKAFWGLVQTYQENYKEVERRLKKEERDETI